jgi:hypothetical protein
LTLQSPQAESVLCLTPDEAALTRVLLVDVHGRVLAASDGKGLLEEIIPPDSYRLGSHTALDSCRNIVTFHKAPWYETYRGLGCCSGLIQSPPIAPR